ncbi:MAG: hypothetical protein IIW94_03735 [Clostridia bacterium]|nr:hypothetical protein [Clostridia bacterium]
MSEAVLVAVIGLCGSGLGSLLGALLSNKVWQYRIEQLEKKVEGLGSIIERTYRLEEENNLFGEKFKVMNHRITDLERRTQ